MEIITKQQLIKAKASKEPIEALDQYPSAFTNKQPNKRSKIDCKPLK